MKQLLSTLLLVFASVSAHTTGGPSFSGKYKINLSLPGHDNAFFCLFTQSNQAVGGYCATEVGNANVTGKFDGRNVSWSYTVKVSGQSITANYGGTVDATGKVSGSMSIPGMPAGIPFTATPSK